MAAPIIKKDVNKDAFRMVPLALISISLATLLHLERHYLLWKTLCHSASYASHLSSFAAFAEALSRYCSVSFIVYVAILYYLDDFINYPTTVGNLLRQSTSTWTELTDKLVVPRNDNKCYNKNYICIYKVLLKIRF